MGGKFDPYAYAIPKRIDPEIHMHDFETFEEAKERKELDAKVLLGSGNEKDRRLARKLRRCKKGRRCLSGACSICRRRTRRLLTANILQFFENYTDKDLSHLTIIFADHQYRPGDLDNLRPRNLVNALTTRFRRLDLVGVIVVGAIDYDLCVIENDYENCFWQVHVHLIVANLTKNDLCLIREAFPKFAGKGVYIPVVRAKIRDRMRQFSYVLKPFFQRRSCYKSATGLRNSKKQPLKESRFKTELLLHLDRFPMTEFLVLSHVRQNGGELRIFRRCVDDKTKNSTLDASK